MKFTCESCSAQYMISDEKVGPSGVKVRCKKCGNVILVRRAAAATNGASAGAPSGAKPEAAASEPGAEAGGAAASGAPAGAAPGLEAELGQAFDHAFGDTPTSVPAPGAAAASAPAAGTDTAATQLMGSEDAAKVFSDRPAPTPSDWYVAIGQAQVGPLPLAEVKKKWEVGDVGPDSLVWRPGMSDWAALSGVQELASYLAPFPRTTAQPARAAEPRMEMPGRVEAPTPAPVEPTWKPAGASALAALANEEIAARTAPEPKAAARPVQGAKALVDALPDGGGVDPTGALPLNIKALEAVTDERKLERRSSLARGAEAARHRRSTTRAVVFGVLIGVVVVAGAAVGGMVLYRKMSPPAPQPVAVKPPPAVPLPPPPAAVTKPAAETTPAPAVAAATAPAQPPAPAAAKEPPAAAKEPPAPPPERHAANSRHAKASRTEAPARRETRKEQPQVASAEPEQAAPTRRKSGGGLLDFESNDKALDDALGGSTGSASRSVYVPPAAAGGGALPAKVSPGEINAAVAARIDSLRKCVSEQKAREPEASGTLKMRWIIQGDGSVRDVKCLTTQYAKGAFSQCIEGVVKGIKFPRSATTGQEVTFPFNF